MVTAVIGASPNPERYAFKAITMLREYNHDVFALGNRIGRVSDVDILTSWPDKIADLNTLTLYLGTANQIEHYGYILNLNPRRIIFNPGAENPELSAIAMLKGIEVVEACTLVMLRTGQY